MNGSVTEIEMARGEDNYSGKVENEEWEDRRRGVLIT